LVSGAFRARFAQPLEERRRQNLARGTELAEICGAQLASVSGGRCRCLERVFMAADLIRVAV
jgi:hypothetical protein